MLTLKGLTKNILALINQWGSEIEWAEILHLLTLAPFFCSIMIASMF